MESNEKITELKEEIKKLRDALEPFVEIFKDVENDKDDHSYSKQKVRVSYGHIRKAYKVFNRMF